MSNPLFNIQYGLFVITTCADGRDNGCISNTVEQVTAQPNRVSMSLCKENFTTELIQRSGRFTVSIISEESDFELFKHFGFQSGRKVNKFADCEAEHRAVNHVLYIPKYTNAYLACRVNKSIDFGTHTMFIADVLDAQVLSDKPSVTYDYYQKNIKPKPQPAEKPKDGKRRWVCKVCGYVYEGDFLPDDIECPLCKHGKEDFEEVF